MDAAAGGLRSGGGAAAAGGLNRVPAGPESGRRLVVVDRDAVHEAVAVAEVEYALVDRAAVVPEGHRVLLPGEPALETNSGTDSCAATSMGRY